MPAARVAWLAAVGTAIVWTFKALVIWEAGGLDRSSLEGVGWAVGSLLFLIAWAALGVTFAHGRPLWLRAVGAVVGVVLGFVLFTVTDGAADLLPDSVGWVQEEAGLWVAALVTLALAWWQRRRLPT